MKQVKNISIQKVDSLIKKNSKVTGLIRIQKNGHFSSFNGIIVERKRNNDGEFYIKAQNFAGKRRGDGGYWQNILLKNIIFLKNEA